MKEVWIIIAGSIERVGRINLFPAAVPIIPVIIFYTYTIYYLYSYYISYYSISYVTIVGASKNSTSELL